METLYFCALKELCTLAALLCFNIDYQNEMKQILFASTAFSYNAERIIMTCIVLSKTCGMFQ